MRHTKPDLPSWVAENASFLLSPVRRPVTSAVPLSSRRAAWVAGQVVFTANPGNSDLPGAIAARHEKAARATALSGETRSLHARAKASAPEPSFGSLLRPWARIWTNARSGGLPPSAFHRSIACAARRR